MPFDPNSPTPTQALRQSQGILLTNNQQLNTSFDVDHMTFNAPANTGYHKQLSFNGAVASPGLNSPQCGVYPGADPITGRTELFFENGVGSFIKQMTNLPVTSFTVPGVYDGFFIDTPWNIRILMGSTTSTLSTAINFALAPLAAFSAVYSCQVSSVTPLSIASSYFNFTVAGVTLYSATNSAKAFVVIGRMP